MLLFLIVAVLIAGCAGVPRHVELPALDVREPAFAATLGAYTGTTVVGGNRIEILLNGDEIFPAKLALIRISTDPGPRSTTPSTSSRTARRPRKSPPRSPSAAAPA